MFRHTGRQLAILNTLVVVAIIILVGAATYFALSRNLTREVDNSLRERITAVQASSASRDDGALASTNPALAYSDDDEGEDDEHEEGEEDEEEDDDHEDREIVASGDTILLVVDETGTVTDNPRDVNLRDLPITEGMEAAFKGATDTRNVTLSDGEHVRVMTAPLFEDGRVAGAVQAVRSLDEHEDQLEIVRTMTMMGVGLGLIVAAPAGYYLSHRAMVPINMAFDRQRAFAADASHELRTPLTLIRANAEFGLGEPGAADPGVRSSLLNILQEVDRTDRQVDDLLLLARLDAGELDLEFEYREVSTVITEAVESMRPASEQRKVCLTLDAGSDAIARLDSDRIHQVVRIILDNAFKHTDTGGQVSVRVRDDGSDVIVTIADTGSGIPTEDLPHVFERFYRVDKSRNRAQGGTGLGLPIARSLVEAHGGTISLDSKPNQGTVVRIKLPAAR